MEQDLIMFSSSKTESKLHLAMYIAKEPLSDKQHFYFLTVLLADKIHVKVSCIIIFHSMSMKYGTYIAEIS